MFQFEELRKVVLLDREDKFPIPREQALGREWEGGEGQCFWKETECSLLITKIHLR